MNPQRALPWCVSLLLVHAAVFLAAAPAAAQADPAPVKTQVIQLRDLNAMRAAQLLRTMFCARPEGVTIAVDEQSNTVAISAAPAVLAEAAKLLDALGVAAASAPEESRDITVIPLHRVNADEMLYDSLQMLLPSSKAGRIALDPGRKLVLVQGPTWLPKAVKTLLGQIELEAAVPRPADRGLQVRLLWFVGGKFAKGQDAIPAGVFKDIADELEKLQLDPMRIAARTLVNVTPGTTFAVSGSAMLETPCLLKFSGKVRSAEDGHVTLDVTATATQPGDGGPGRLCELQTELRIPMGKLVMVGAAPVRGEPTAFVVQVVEPGMSSPPAKKAAAPAQPKPRR
jgi:Bacterial type II/III secretion system short domain